MNLSYAEIINQHTGSGDCFDSFDRADGLFVLCDGVNSSKNGGKFSTLLCKTFLEQCTYREFTKTERSEEFSSILFSVHHNLKSLNLGASSTLISVFYNSKFFELISVGDSFGEVFKKTMDGDWRHDFSMPRDIDTNGNPWQLIGSEVFQKVNYRQFNGSNRWCIFLMSDGLGNHIKGGDLMENLSLIRSDPGNLDLRFIANELVNKAKMSGSLDDISICIIFLGY